MSVAIDPISPAVPLSPGWRALASRGDLRRYRKGVLLIQEGDQGDTLYIVLSGSVKVFSTDERDREITYGTCGPGECLGEMSLDGGPRSASVITLEKTECAVITRQTLKDYIVRNPQFAFELLERMIRRVRVLTENARGLALLDVYGRLVRVLNGLAQTDDDGRRVIAAKPTHQDLANRVGASREMVSKLMKDLALGGYVEAGRSRLVIVKPLPASW